MPNFLAWFILIFTGELLFTLLLTKMIYGSILTRKEAK